MGRSSRTAERRKGGNYTPKPTQVRIVAGTLAGKSKSELQRETGVARSTIRRILSQSEVQALIATYRDQMLDLVPAALAVCRRNLCGKRGSWQLALEILKGCQVLVARQTKDMRETHDEIYSLTDDQLREYIRTGKMPVTTPTDAYRRSA